MASLPILQYREEIIATVQSNQVVIIKAETGAGKSTQVPQFLLECAPKIVVTQPRRMAAISIAERVATELGCAVGGMVGYRTMLESKSGRDTRLLFVTDGLELMHQVFAGQVSQNILVIDEVHEWNLNIETLVAWTHYQLKRGAPYKVVIMSATVETEPLREYFDGAAIIEVPGRTFPVTEEQTTGNILRDAADLLEQGHNVLVFQPGKKEIKETVASLAQFDVEAEVLPLHADMPYSEQLRCFRSYPRPKCIVATNVAQTSITIPDIDAVVDSGLERRIEYVGGVEGLYSRAISGVDRAQRKGRAGRTKPGLYIDACPAMYGEQPFYPVPDILRLPLDKVLLQLARAGMEIDELKFFHALPKDQVQKARQTLYSLDCVDRFGSLTRIGTRVASLPVATRWGRMLVEAEDRKVLHYGIILVSVMEQGRITNGKGNKWRRGVRISSWSDVFAQLGAYGVALHLPYSLLEEYGIDPKAFSRAREMHNHLSSVFEAKLGNQPTTGREKDIVCCLYAGLADSLYKKSLVRGYKNKTNDVRNLPPYSIVDGAEWIVGLPWNLHVQTDLGPKTRRTITMATRVDPVLFKQVAPRFAAEMEKFGK